MQGTQNESPPAVLPEKRAGARIGRQHLAALSQPISVHGAGTVRHGAAVNFSIAQCRHNVSARDGGIPASRMRFGEVWPGQRAIPNLPLDALFTSSIHRASNPHTTDSPADAVVLTAGDLPSFHRPATAAGLTSFLAIRKVQILNQPN
jgi:hypothetical protein